jgi:hypothetical protein
MTPACDEPSCPLIMSRCPIPYRFVARPQLLTRFFSFPTGKGHPSGTFHHSTIEDETLTVNDWRTLE